MALCGYVPAPRVARLCVFRDEQGQPIDQGLVLYFPSPASFTGEDVLELHGHGGPVVMQMLLSRCIELGARLAEPGEFSKRAFLNGKMDLVQAESVADLIAASSEAAARSAMRSLSGVFSQEIETLHQELVSIRIELEAGFDFPEEEIERAERSVLDARIEGVQARLETLLARATQGTRLRHGLSVVLVGAPNVGKSSLLNALAGEECAIVTDIPGTTRDSICQTLHIEGLALHIIDTAGLRSTQDPVERLGMARTWREIEKADLLLILCDASDSLAVAPESRVSGFPSIPDAPALPCDLPRLIVHNKIDLVPCPAFRKTEGACESIGVSARTGEGLDLLRGVLLEQAGWHNQAETTFMARERHLDALRRSLACLQGALTQIQNPEMMAEDLRHAQEALGEIRGEFTPDDLLGEIFSRFCIGK
jgi:tRNA modification GTPase